MDLLNLVWKDIHNPKQWKSHSDPVRGLLKDSFSSYRRRFSQARPFSIDNRALEVAYDLSLEDPEKVAKRLMLARLPFPKTWIEIDFHHKVSYAHGKGHATPPNDETPFRLGWLLEEDANDPHMWTSIVFAKLASGNKVANPKLKDEIQTTPSMVSFMVDTLNRTPPLQINGISEIPKDTMEKMFKGQLDASEHAYNSFRHIGWGYAGDVTFFTFKEAMLQIVAPLSLQNSLNIGLSPSIQQIVSHLESTGNQTIYQKILNTAIESRGDIRLLVSLLSLINEVPITCVPAKPNGSFMASGQMKPFLQNNRVTINIPTKRYMGTIQKIFRNAAKRAKARHEVRGHWRLIVHKNDHIRIITRADGKKEKTVIRAGTAERVWIANHERGDASLGYVKHSYSVEKSR